MKYRTENELEHFQFKESYISEIQAVNGTFCMLLDNVTILPENSCNRDIRIMRANGLWLKITEAELLSMVEEGYKVYDADGNLLRREDDREIAPEAYAQHLKELAECMVYAVEKSEGEYRISIDTEDHTYFVRVAGTGDVETWDRFLNL